MSMDGVVPPQSGPSRRPAGGPVNHPGAETPQGPAARRYGAQGHDTAQEHAAEGHGAPEPGIHTTNHPRFERVVGGAENSGLGSSAAWHGPIGSGDAPGDPAAGRGSDPDSADDGSTVEIDTGSLRLGDAPLSAAEANLANALRASVSGVGSAGPPPGGLVRVRRKARARQRNRIVAASSAGILMLAVAVTMATGARFDIVPTLTGAAGANGDGAPGNQPGPGGTSHPSAAANGGHAVWPTGSPGKTGLAIGPVAPVVATPSAVAAAQGSLCTATSLKTSTTMGPTVNGVAYGHVDAVAQSSCVAVGPPVLTVANQAGTASSSVVIVKENTLAASQLPLVPTWGRTISLKAGQGYEFQFAWAMTACAGSASPSPVSAVAPNASIYYLGYAVTGTTPTAVITLNAPCGAQVYVTDIYDTGAFPLPKAPVPPPPVVSPSTPVPPPPSTPAPPPSTSPPPVTPSTQAPSPSPSESSSASTGGLASGQATTTGG